MIDPTIEDEDRMERFKLENYEETEPVDEPEEEEWRDDYYDSLI